MTGNEPYVVAELTLVVPPLMDTNTSTHPEGAHPSCPQRWDAPSESSTGRCLRQDPGALYSTPLPPPSPEAPGHVASWRRLEDDRTRPSASVAYPGPHQSPPSEKLTINYLLQAGRSTPTGTRRPRSPAPASVPAALLSHLPSKQSNSTKVYQLEVVQHPVRTAACVHRLSRLPLSPPLVAQLTVRDPAGVPLPDEGDVPFLVAHVVLTGTEAPDGALYGTLVASPQRMRGLDGRPGTFFVFPDVSVGTRGHFALKVVLLNVMSGGSGRALATVSSRSFDVVAPEDYVAPAQTALTQALARQGVQMYAFASPMHGI